MISVEHVSKDFVDSKKGLVRAVRDVSLFAQEGEVFGLLGVNGAGKTTLLRILSTMLKPSTGRATIAGFDVQSNSTEVRRKIGFLSASTALYGRLSGIEVLRYFGGLYGLSGTRLSERIEFVTEKLRLDEFSNRLCDKLSTGQKQRISIARAILHDPPVLFFDEPTTGLDVVTSQTVMEFIEDIRRQGKTVVLCTHIMSEAERLADRLAVIHEGRICGEGTVDEIKQQTQEATLEKAFLKLVEYQSEVVGA